MNQIDTSPTMSLSQYNRDDHIQRYKYKSVVFWIFLVCFCAKWSAIAFECHYQIQDTIWLIHEGSFATTGRQTVADRRLPLSENKVFTHSVHQWFFKNHGCSLLLNISGALWLCHRPFFYEIGQIVNNQQRLCFILSQTSTTPLYHLNFSACFSTAFH